MTYICSNQAKIDRLWGIQYDVVISRIFVFPHCHSAIVSRPANMKGFVNTIVIHIKGQSRVLRNRNKTMGGEKVVSVKTAVNTNTERQKKAHMFFKSWTSTGSILLEIFSVALMPEVFGRELSSVTQNM